ncbi:hypothetical protein FRB98_001292 [Tulasnella sp. 332]|nr:hypothetical protein FRB98_001292 [Tulasnella sp. 332]
MVARATILSLFLYAALSVAAPLEKRRLDKDVTSLKDYALAHPTPRTQHHRHNHHHHHHHHHHKHAKAKRNHISGHHDGPAEWVREKHRAEELAKRPEHPRHDLPRTQSNGEAKRSHIPRMPEDDQERDIYRRRHHHDHPSPFELGGASAIGLKLGGSEHIDSEQYSTSAAEAMRGISGLW